MIIVHFFRPFLEGCIGADFSNDFGIYLNRGDFTMSDFNEGSPQGSNTKLLVRLGGCGCLTVIGLVIFMLLPTIADFIVRTAKAPSARMTCSNNLKLIGVALHTYHDAYKSLPPAYTTDEDGKPLHSWRVLILPYLEQQVLYDQIRLDEPWDSEYNKHFHNRMPPFYICPSAKPGGKEKGLTSYMRVVGPGTSTDGPSTVTFDEVTAGTSNVIMLVEVIPTTCWMAPVDVQESDLTGDFRFSRESGVGSMHRGGINICWMDTSVDFMPDSEAPQLKDRVKIKR